MASALVRELGRRCLFGRELGAARDAHWTMQWQSTATIQERQWAQVRACVAYARQASDFYRGRLAAVHLDGELTADAFRRIRPLSRQEVVGSGAGIRTSGGRPGVMRRRSGGSSGDSVQIPLDRGTYRWYTAGTWRGLRWWGADLADRGAVVLGSGATGVRRLVLGAKDWVMNWLRLPVDERFDDRLPAMVDRMQRFGPAFIYGYPSAVHPLAVAVRDRGWRPTHPLKVIALTGEPVYAFQRQAIARAFHCPVVEEYGSGELGSMGFECPEGSLHVTAENVFLEIVPSDLPADGAGGPILATQLHNRLFPLIRYETGDVGLLRTEPCRCGRGLPTLRVFGRLGDRLEGPGGTILARPKVEELFTALPEPLQGRVQVVHPAPALLALHVARPVDPARDLGAATSAARVVFGPDWRVEAAAVGRLARLVSGKLPYFLRATPR